MDAQPEVNGPCRDARHVAQVPVTQKVVKDAEGQEAATEPKSGAEGQAAAIEPKSPIKNKAGGSQVGSPQRLLPVRSPRKRPASAAGSLLADGLSSPSAAGSVPGLPNGWPSFKKTRKHGATANRKDIYYTSPEGKVFPSLIQAKKYVGSLAIDDDK